MELHQRSTIELDAEVRTVKNNGADANDDERDSDARRPFPPADEIVMSVMEYAKHQMLSVCALFERVSQII